MNSIHIVVPTRDRPLGLQRTLDSIRSLHRPRAYAIDLFVTVVDDGSAVAAESSVRVPPGLSVRFVRLETSGGPAHARNLGVGSATADLVAFVDDDVEVDPGWLSHHLETVSNGPRTVVSIGPLLAPNSWNPTPWNRWEAATLAAEYERMAGGVYAPTARQFFTGNTVLVRDLFLAAGGFDERFRRAEDVELALRIEQVGGHFVFTPDAIGWHHARRSLKSWRTIPRQYALYDAAISRLHDPHWSGMVEDELRKRNRITRAALAVARHAPFGGAVATCATWSGIVLSRGRTMPVGQRLLSLAWQAEYVREWSRFSASSSRLARAGFPQA